MPELLLTLCLLCSPTPTTVLTASQESRDPLYVGLLTSYGVLQFTDNGLTLYGLGSGQVHEANPILRPLSDRPLAFSFTKAAVAAGSILAIREVGKRNKKAAKILLGILNGLYAGVVIWNAKQLK